MKRKEGRDFIELADCVASLKDGGIYLVDMSGGFFLSTKDFNKLVDFVKKGAVGTQQSVAWQSIETAPKDGRVILVNDQSDIPGTSWVAAKWLDGEQWSGWVYDDELLQDSAPLGPCPTAWFDLPPLP